MRGEGRSGRRKAVTAGVTAIAGGLALALTVVAPAARAGPTSPAAATGLTTTPILSARRIPGWVAETVAAQRLDAALAALLAAPVLGGAARTGCLAVSQGGRLLYSANAAQGLIPASNMKLLTATAVLDRLGPTHRIATRVLAARPAHGVVAGNLYLVGAGDPLLRTPAYAAALGPDETVYTSLPQLARQVVAAGITQITGAVVGDESRYDQLRTVPTWKPVYAAEGDVGPLSALDVNDGTAPAAPNPPPSGTSASALQAAVSSNPAVRAAAEFTTLLRADGVRVAGGPAIGTAPAGAPAVTSIASAPLAAEVGTMLTVSDDTAAELFTKELGYQASGSGTTAAGAAAIRADLAADGLPLTGLVIDDGSGLDRGDRVTCNLLLADLEHVGATGPLAHGLPIAGQTGTLRSRMVGTPAAGRVRAKTGTLDDVVGLSGFVAPGPGVTVPGSVLGQPVAFALVLDGAPTLAAGRTVADQIAVALATYPQAPKPADIAPRR
jgi:D-alanyl-D-alanine carboxypeptidase/D-alanyl-D-alanine-endopeptidase (penicillin-binding protein 4)